MACCCNTNPCSCSPAPVTCCTPTTESVEYTFENANLVGIGFFDNETDRLVQFRGAVSNSAALTITLDAGNNVLVFDFDDAALVADIPNADTTTRGILETATNGEALAKAATDKILTPSNLAALGGTSTFAGLLELATNAETITGTSTTLAVTPAGLAAAVALEGTTTFADATARNAATPAFNGQFGAQLDTNAGFVAGSVTMGDWWPLLTLGATNNSLVSTTLNLNGDAFTIVGNGDLILASATLSVSGATSTFEGSTTFFGLLAGNSQIVDFANTVFFIANNPMGARTLLGADVAGLGVVEEYPVANFISSYDTQTGYTNFANGVVRRTCDTTTVTLPELAQIVGTLINDLKAIQLPAT